MLATTPWLVPNPQTAGPLAGVDAIAAIAAQLLRDGAGRESKGSGNLSQFKF